MVKNTLPTPLALWFKKRKWQLFPHQQAMLEAARDEDILLLAPTGSGKTLSGFLPTLVDLVQSPVISRQSPEKTSLATGDRRLETGLHTIYLSPLKALANDIHRNLTSPVQEMALPITIGARTGDTPQKERVQQKKRPPNILLTTPESLALMLTYEDSKEIFANLRTIILDEIHTLVATKRGDQTSLLLARLQMLAPQARRIGLSATVAAPDKVAAWLGRNILKGGEHAPLTQSPPLRPPSKGSLSLPKDQIQKPDVIDVESGANPRSEEVSVSVGGDCATRMLVPLARSARIIRALDKSPPELSILFPEKPLPLAGHYGVTSVQDIYDAIKQTKSAIVFVNTRAQAEKTFQSLWTVNEDGLGIALHHGSLTKDQRQKVEAAMAAGKVRAVVATSSLDLGIDWGNVDLVIQIGAPKGLSRLRQRIGRSNHRIDLTSRAVLVPTNRFEALECEAAVEALADGQLDDLPPHEKGSLDVLAQHVFSCACAGGFVPDELLPELRLAYPYRNLTRAQFDEVIAYVQDGGYVLKRYERFQRMVEENGRMVPASKQAAQRHRMNIGTIVESEMLKVVRITGKKQGSKRRAFGVPLGQVEERLVTGMKPGDTFLFAGQVLEFRQIREMTVEVVPAASPDPKIPSYNGGKMPMSTHLAARVRRLIRDESAWKNMPDYIRQWLWVQQQHFYLPPVDGLMVECFEYNKANYLVAYPFEGRAVHQSLGFLVTLQMEKARLGPLGFTVSDYGFAVWSVKEPSEEWVENLFQSTLTDAPLEDWLMQSAMLKRVFRNNAVIAGLIERKVPGRQNTGKQVTFSTDLIYDVLNKYEPDHLLLRSTRLDTEREMADLPRLKAFLERVQGKVEVRNLEKVSPFAIPIILEITPEGVGGGGTDAALIKASKEEYAEQLYEEASAEE